MATPFPELEQEYKELFNAPYANYRWASRRGRYHWVELEGWQDSLAGPISAIIKYGDCEYVYARHDWPFIAVHDPESLRAHLLECHAQLAAGLDKFAPQTSDEVHDLEHMRSVVLRMSVLIDQACDIERARWLPHRQAQPKPKTFATLQALGCWTPIRDCPGRFVLRGMTPSLSLRALFGADLLVQEFQSPLARTPVFVAALADGGLISYHNPDGRWVHTLGNEEGFQRKLEHLQLKL